MSQAVPLSIAVFISGGGTTLNNLYRSIDLGELPAEIALVISSNPKSPGLALAAARGARAVTILKRDYPSEEAYREAMFTPCREAGIGLVAMAGYLKHLLIPADFALRVMNIHPSLIPAFCGKGYYGQRVHAAALEYGVKYSGCTVHFVDDHFDHGPIIVQRLAPVLSDDTPE